MKDTIAGTAQATSRWLAHFNDKGTRKLWRRAPPVPHAASGLIHLRTYLVILVLALLLPALGLGAAAVWQAITAYRGAFEARLQDTSRALALAVDAEIQTVTTALTALAESPELQPGGNLATFDAHARRVGDMLGSWIVLRGPGPDLPQVVNTALPPGAALPRGIEAENRELLRRALETGRPQVSDLFVGPATGQLGVVAVVPSPRTEAGGRTWILGVTLTPDRLARLLAAQRIGAGGAAILVDGRGTVVARSKDQAAYIGRQVPVWFAAATAGRDDGMTGGASITGKDVVLGFQRLRAAPGWVMAVAAPADLYAQSWRGPLRALAVGGLIVLAGGLVLALWLGQNLLRPVWALAADAKAVADAEPGEVPPAPSAPPSSVAELEALRRGIAAADATLRGRAEVARLGEERLRVMVNELNHRVKNTLVTVQFIASQTLRGADPVVRRELEARLLALAAAHDVLTRQGWAGAEIDEVVTGVLAPHGGRDGGRFRVAGPPLRLVPHAAVALSMALHELATNALKYGALSVPEGYVEIRWEVAPGTSPRFGMLWTERGGPPVAPPARRSFGTRLVERSLAQDLGGTARIDFTPAGVVCAIAAPLASVAAPAEPAPLPRVG